MNTIIIDELGNVIGNYYIQLLYTGVCLILGEDSTQLVSIRYMYKIIGLIISYLLLAQYFYLILIFVHHVMVQIVEHSLIIVHNLRTRCTELESTREIILHNCIVKVHKSDVLVII